MDAVSRRRAMQLAGSSAAAPWVGGAPCRAQASPGAGAAAFDMASFAGGDADAAFAKALAAIAKASAEGAKAGRPAPIVLNLEPGATYRIKRPLAFRQLRGFTLNGNGAQLINTTLDSTLLISGSSGVTVRDLTIDYDPLPFTQGTIAGFDRPSLQIMVRVDPGYPDDPALLATVADGFFKVMDRRTRALKPGARDFLNPIKAERVGPGLIRVHLRWGANETFPSQLPIAVGDVVAITNSLSAAIQVDDCAATRLIDLKLLASPAMGIVETGGAGGMTLQRVSVVPGPRPRGAATDRLVSTCADGAHFGAVGHGPTIEDCVFANTSDDAVNVHGFYCYVLQKTGPARYLLSPKWDVGLAAGDEIETCQQGTFRSLGRTRIVQLSKRHAPELKGRIAQLWKGRSPTTQPDLIYDVQLQQDLPLKVADAVSSLSRVGAGAAIRRSSFHACGRVLLKSPDTIVEDCTFTFSSGVALQAGSDIGFWSESGFARNLTLRNNRFTHCVTGANELTAGNGALGVIFVGMVAPEGATGFENNFENRNVTISGNRIDESFTYAIFVSNADGVRVVDNVIGRTFIRGAFEAGQAYGVNPSSAIYIGRSRNAEIGGNAAARGRVASAVVAVDRTCDRGSVHVGNNTLT